VTAAAAPHGDAAVVVAAGRVDVGLDQRLLRPLAGDLGIDRDGAEAGTRRHRPELLDWHG